MKKSIIVPVYNEEGNIGELIDKISLNISKEDEIIIVNDGSIDNTEAEIKTKNCILISLEKNMGKGFAMRAGIKRAQGDFIVFMGGDGQDNPEEIPDLYNLIISENYDLVSGWKKKRHDPISKTLPTKLFNWATRKMSGIHLHDFNCGLKAYKHDVVKAVEVYGEMHRYIPVLAKNAGFNKIDEKIVAHQARKYGVTKFGIDRFINGFLDLITIWFLSKFGKRPMHLFGLLGTLMFFIGLCFSFYLGIDKLFFNTTGRLITERPQFYLALVTMIIGTQFFLAGFLGEIILRTKNNEERYKVSEEI